MTVCEDYFLFTWAASKCGSAYPVKNRFVLPA